MSNEWPMPSSPNWPPAVNFYFSRLIGGARQDIMCHNFAHPWQAGRFWQEMIEDGEVLMIGEYIEGVGGFDVEYRSVLERDASGGVVRARTFWGHFRGCEHDAMLAAAASKKSVELPHSERQWMQMAKTGVWDVVEVLKLAKMRSSEAPAARSPEGNARDVVRRPSASRSGLITLATLSSDAGVDAGDVRAVLRRRGIEKPDVGWAGAEGASILGVMSDAIAAVKRGEKK